MLGITDDEIHKPTRKRKKKGITFNDDEEVINPEDVDPSVGRFRNLVQTTVVPSKVGIIAVNLVCETIINYFLIYLTIDILENAYGRRLNIFIRRSQSSETRSTYSNGTPTLSRFTTRTVHPILAIS